MLRWPSKHTTLLQLYKIIYQAELDALLLTTQINGWPDYKRWRWHLVAHIKIRPAEILTCTLLQSLPHSKCFSICTVAAVQSCEPMLIIFYLHNNGFFPTLLLKEAASEGFVMSLNPCNCDHLPCWARQWNSKRDWPCNFKTQLIFLLMLWLFLVKFMHFTDLETGSLYGTRMENNLKNKIKI